MPRERRESPAPGAPAGRAPGEAAGERRTETGGGAEALWGRAGSSFSTDPSRALSVCGGNTVVTLEPL